MNPNMAVYRSRSHRYLSLIAMYSLLGIQFLSSSIHAQQQSDHFAPEISSQNSLSNERPEATLKASQFMLATAHPLASQAGYQILEQGGNVVDAMVAVQTVLGLVEPQSSGLGGGAFALLYQAKDSRLRSFDARETAPIEASSKLFIADNNQAMAFYDAVVGGRSVGTPGTVKLLWTRHQQQGSMPWASLLQPAIKLATEGFKVSPRLAQSLLHAADSFIDGSPAKRYFFPNGQALTAGTVLRNPDYANTLKALAKHGGDYFYRAPFSQAIVSAVRQHQNPGLLQQQDFNNYRIIEREPVCFDYQDFSLCGMGAPSSGALSVNQIMGILSHTNFATLKPESTAAWHLVAEASRLAFADRGRYIADPDFFTVPQHGLLDANYLKRRSQLLSSSKAAITVDAGLPPGVQPSALTSGPDTSLPSTSHFVIVDAEKNILSMTTTIENGFGSRVMVKGFLLNNELTDFSFTAKTEAGALIANRVQAGKRPRSSMAPTIVFKQHKPLLAIGSPGGSRIINYVANSLIRILDWQVPVFEAINRPHLVNRFGSFDLEQGTQAESYHTAFQALGHQTNIRDLNSGLHAIQFTDDQLLGAADLRREGAVLGR